MLDEILKRLQHLFIFEPLVWELENPFGKGDITSDGVQYCTEKTTTDANIYNDVEVVTVGKNRPPGKLVCLSVGLTCSLAAASTATADLIYQWLAKDIPGNGWQALHTAVTIADINTTNVERTYSGNFAKANGDGELTIIRVPFQLKLQIQANEANEGQGKTKNSCWVKYCYIPD